MSKEGTQNPLSLSPHSKIGGVENTVVVALLTPIFREQRKQWRRLSARELGDSLGALAHGVLGELTGESQAHSSLHFPG